ncbi:MAG: hypothetical protein AAGM22_27980 [Acidobacteriota bacterium]
MTTFFQMAQAMDPKVQLDLKQMVELNARIRRTPQSALLLNPVPYGLEWNAPRVTPKASNDNREPLAELG